MITYYVNMDAQFESQDIINEMEDKHKLKIVNTTQFQIELCRSRNEEYRGPNTYLFIGDWTNIVDYFLWDYPLQDLEELADLVKCIKTMEI